MIFLKKLVDFIVTPLGAVVLMFLIFVGVLWYRDVLWILPTVWENSGGLEELFGGFGLSSVYVLLGSVVVVWMYYAKVRQTKNNSSTHCDSAQGEVGDDAKRAPLIPQKKSKRK